MTPTSATPKSEAVDANDFLVVDCLLPGQVRKLGTQMTYVTARRPIKTSAADCEIRGGEYVAYDRADYKTALNIWLPLAKEGDPEAMTNVGEIYEKGLGVQPDYDAATHWYQKAAELDFMRAQINLGYLHEMGLGVERNPQKALEWYRRASGMSGEIDLHAAAVPVAATPDPVSEEMIGSLEQEVQDLRQESADLRAELSRARKVLDQPRSTKPVVVTQPVMVPDPSTHTELVAVKATLQQREQELADLDHLLKQTRSELDNTQSALKDRERQVQKQDERMSEVRRTLTARELELQSRITQLGEAEAQLVEQRERQRVLQEDTEQNKVPKAEVEKREQAMAMLESRLAQTRKDLQSARDQFQQQLDDAAAQTKELVKMRELAAVARAELSRRVDQLNGLEQELLKQREISASSAQQINELQATIADLEQENARQREVEKTKRMALADKIMAGPELTLIDPVISPTRSNEPLVLRSAVQSRQVVGMVSAPAGLLSLTVNDTAAEPNEQGVFKEELTLASTLNPVSVVAIDNQGKRVSLGFSFMYERSGTAESIEGEASPVIAPEYDVDFGDYHALVIGNNDYNTMVDLRTPINDATEISEILEQRYGVNTTLLLDANRYQIMSALNDIRGKLTSDDNLLIYYAGHGVLDEVNMRGHWLPVDAEAENTANWISNVSVTDMLNAIAAKQILVISDSCYSGSLTRSSNPRLERNKTSDERMNWLKTMSEKKARMVLTSGGLKPVLDSAGGEHSVFASALLEVLRNNTDILEGRRLYREVAARVAYSAANVGFDQVPEYAPIRFAGHESGEFFLVPKG